MATLAVRIVDHGIERGKGAKVVEPLFGEHETMPFRIVFDEELERAGPHWCVRAQHRWWYETPVRCLAQHKGSDLACGQRAGGKVPQRPLAARGLVDRECLFALGRDSRKKDIVRRIREQAQDFA